MLNTLTYTRFLSIVITTKKVVVIGCGEIGSRHLQGLAGIRQNLEIDVVEPRNSARDLGLRRYKEAKERNTDFEMLCRWHAKTEEVINNESDLVIVATDAASRSETVKSLVSKENHRFFLLEKPVCQSEGDYNYLLNAFKLASCKAWVNTIRRYNAFYRHCAHIKKQGRCSLEVSGKHFGLGSNAIHFLDLFRMITGMHDYVFKSAEFERKIYPSKRGGSFIEVQGCISGTDKAGNTFRISSLASEPEGMIVKISSTDSEVVVDEVNCSVQITEDDKLRKQPFQELMVSKSTTAICADILNTGDCLLPSLESLSGFHMELFRLLREHLEQTTGLRYDQVPIT